MYRRALSRRQAGSFKALPMFRRICLPNWKPRWKRWTWAAFGALAAVCAHWLHNEGDGNYHFRFGVWQDAGNLSADQSSPHPRCYAFQPGAWWHRAELHQVPVCRGLSRAADPCMCCNLRSAHSRHRNRRRSHWGDLGNCWATRFCFASCSFKTGSIAQRIFGAH